MDKQQTLKESAFISGIALHSGVRARLRIHPAPPDTGIIFRRVDLPGAPEVPALAAYVADTRRGTTIATSPENVVMTIEHIMSSLHVLHVDNAYVEMDGPEPPILDGSAQPFFEMIRAAGVVEQEAEARYFRCDEILYVEGGATKIVLTPSEEFKITCFASFPGNPFDPQFGEYTVTPEVYASELAGARTFVDFKDLGQLLAMGLVKGGSLDAAAIIHNGAIICKEELRFRDEIVRHKAMDLVGDLFLCGRRVKANVIAIKPGHRSNVEMARLMLAGCARN